MTEADRKHAQDIVNWFSEAALDKYAAGCLEHGGHLPDKGGVLREAEAEILDFAVYVRTLRAQLERVLTCIERGHPEVAGAMLTMILRGSPDHRLPDVPPGIRFER